MALIPILGKTNKPTSIQHLKTNYASSHFLSCSDCNPSLKSCENGAAKFQWILLDHSQHPQPGQVRLCTVKVEHQFFSKFSCKFLSPNNFLQFEF